nr:MAG TPA: hypothetical protein [Caudoviricetes sp.]
MAFSTTIHISCNDTYLLTNHTTCNYIHSVSYNIQTTSNTTSFIITNHAAYLISTILIIKKFTQNF